MRRAVSDEHPTALRLRWAPQTCYPLAPPTAILPAEEGEVRGCHPRNVSEANSEPKVSQYFDFLGKLFKKKAR
jgi:hypothetical protein